MINFFISSTFTDMHEERDLVQNVIQPEINKDLNEQGVYVSFVDLRWGIDTFTDDNQNRILNACFDQIKSCKPYFIVFIGGRYGWIPNKEMIEPYIERFGNKDDILNKSITELEVMYALKLYANDIGHCLFYFKEDAYFENEDSKLKISALKTKIESIAPKQIRKYKSLANSIEKDKLVDQVVTDIEDLLIERRQLRWEERVSNYMDVKKELALPSLSFEWLEDLKKGGYDVAVINYPECRQVWSAIANFCNEIESKQSQTGIWNRLFSKHLRKTASIFISIGASNEISTTRDLLFYLCYKMHILLHNKAGLYNENDSIITLCSQFSSLLQEYTEKDEELYICIMGFDKLLDAYETQWMPNKTNNNVKWIISVSDGRLANNLPLASYKKCIFGSIHVECYNYNEQLSAFEKKYKKTLAPNVVKAIGKLPFANDFTMIEVICNRLSHFDNKDIPHSDTKSIPTYMEKYIERAPNNYKDQISYFLSDDYKRFNTELCELLFLCMANFKRGLSVRDMEGIANSLGYSWSELDIIRFINYESLLLCSYNDGRYDISSDIINDIICREYSQKFKVEYCDKIYKYMSTLEDNAPLKIDNFWKICFFSNQPKAYLDYLYRLYENMITPKIIYGAFIPLFKNVEAMNWLDNSMRKNNFTFKLANFASFLVSTTFEFGIKSETQITESFLQAFQLLGNEEHSIAASFQIHYALAFTNFNNHSFSDFIKEFNICNSLSKQEYKQNPPNKRYIDDSHECFTATFQDILADYFGFSFVEQMAALMSKYFDLPQKFKDNDKAIEFAKQASEIREKIAKAAMIQPKDITRMYKGENVKKTKPSWLRGKAIDLCKSAIKEEDDNMQQQIYTNALEIFNQILRMPEDNLTGIDAQIGITDDYELSTFRECYRDRALTYEHLAELNKESEYELLQKSYLDLQQYENNNHTDQIRKDFFRITQSLAILACEREEYEAAMTYIVKLYEEYALLTSGEWYESLDVWCYSLDEQISNCIHLILKNKDLLGRWITDFKSLVNTFQSQGEYNACITVCDQLIESLRYCVLELNYDDYQSVFISIMEDAAFTMDKEKNKSFLEKLYDNTHCMTSNKDLSEQDFLSAINIMIIHTKQIVYKREFKKGQAECEEMLEIIKTKQINSIKSEELEMKVFELLTNLLIEQNDVVRANFYMSKIVNKYKNDYEHQNTLDSVIKYTNALLNQVILWDKMTDNDTMNVLHLISGENYNDEAKKLLYEAYLLCYNNSESNIVKALLMRRIQQTFNIVKERGLGFIATSDTLKHVEDLRKIYNEAHADEKETRHDEYINKLNQLIISLREAHLVDIYFSADFFAGILSILGQDAWKQGKKIECENYYSEAVQIRMELDSEGISQDMEQFANLLYLYSLVLLAKPITNELLTEVIGILNKCQSIFKNIEQNLNESSLRNYSSCCFNYGQFLCMYTNVFNKEGLEYIQTAINIAERIVYNFGVDQFRKDLNLFKEKYFELQNR